MKKKGLLAIVVLLCVAVGVQSSHLFAENESGKEKGPQILGDTLPEDTVFTRTTKDGKIIVRDKDEIDAETKKDMQAVNNFARSRNIGGAREISYGVVNFRTKNSTKNTSYTEVATGEKGYTNGTYQADGAFLGYENGKVKFMQSGVIGLVNPSDVTVIEYDDAAAVNNYSASQGNFYHNVALNVNTNSYDSNLFGKQPSYIKSGTYYYSYDGHYFYTTYQKMINDYKAGTRKNSVNPNDPYFNYYQFASVRTKTSYTASDLNKYISSYLGSNYSKSKLNGMGQAMIDAQNKYGSNALLTMGVAINESAFGMSNLALNRNNLFGLDAIDSNPDQASSFASPKDSITEFAKYYVHLWYSTPGAGSTYHGAFLGDKASGMNVSYASDPNWGEKAAAWMWFAQKYVDKSDVGDYNIGFKATGTINIRKEATTSSPSLYTTPKNTNMAFVILGEVTGQKVDGSTKWYKIQLDPSLNSSRSAIDFSGNSYNFSKSYGYIHSSLLSKALYSNEGGGSDEPSTPSDPDTSYKKGDVNGDGYISSKDYNAIKNHITGYRKLTGDALKRADVNGDGYISSKDYNAIKNHITGYKLLF